MKTKIVIRLSSNITDKIYYFERTLGDSYKDVGAWLWTGNIECAKEFTYEEIRKLREELRGAYNLNHIDGVIEVISISTPVYFDVRSCQEDTRDYIDEEDWA